MSAILKFDFKKENNYIFSKENYLNYTKKTQFSCDIFPKTRANKNKQCTHLGALKDWKKFLLVSSLKRCSEFKIGWCKFVSVDCFDIWVKMTFLVENTSSECSNVSVDFFLLFLVALSFWIPIPNGLNKNLSGIGYLTLIYPAHFEDVPCQSGVNHIFEG